MALGYVTSHGLRIPSEPQTGAGLLGEDHFSLACKPWSSPSSGIAALVSSPGSPSSSSDPPLSGFLLTSIYPLPDDAKRNGLVTGSGAWGVQGRENVKGKGEDREGWGDTGPQGEGTKDRRHSYR